MLKSVKNIKEARQAEEQNVSALQPVKDDCGPQVVGIATSTMNDVPDLDQNFNGDDATTTSFKELVSSLNTYQGKVLKHVK